MKAYVEVPFGLSRAMARVANALRLYAPADVQFTTLIEEADLAVLHVIGYPETVEALDDIRARRQRYAMIQYCLRTTQRPSTRDWRPLWATADLVWSYYDLPAAVRDDHGEVDFVHYDAPLGVDSWAFYPYERPTVRNYTVLTSGYVAETEGVREAAEAVRRVAGNQFHLGPRMKLASLARYELGIADDQLASVYRACRYVAGLRRAEGFELPAAEGLVCGARPVCFDRPHYRRWFEPWARFVPEGSFEEVADALERQFRQHEPVSFEEATAAADRFDWARIVPAFWACVGIVEAQKQETA